MRPRILPGSALDAASVIAFGAVILSEGDDNDLPALRSLRDSAIDAGAHVLLVVWPSRLWAVLCIEFVSGTTAPDQPRLILRISECTLLLEQLHQRVIAGRPLAWLELSSTKEDFIDG